MKWIIYLNEKPLIGIPGREPILVFFVNECDCDFVALATVNMEAHKLVGLCETRRRSTTAVQLGTNLRRQEAKISSNNFKTVLVVVLLFGLVWSQLKQVRILSTFHF